MSNSIRLVNAQNTTELAFDDQRVIDLRIQPELLRMIAHILIKLFGIAGIIERVVDDQRLTRRGAGVDRLDLHT